MLQSAALRVLSSVTRSEPPPPRRKPAHRPWWLPLSRTCPACWCGWWCWCWAGRPRWGGWRWRRATAAGSAGSTSTPAGWPGSRGWSCWGPRRSCGRGWSLEEKNGREGVILCQFARVEVVIEAAIHMVIMECSAIKKTLWDCSGFFFSLCLQFALFLLWSVGNYCTSWMKYM